MKLSRLLFRASLGLLIGLIFSLASVKSVSATGFVLLDRVLLVLVPALAIAYLFFEVFPYFQKMMAQSILATRIILFALAFTGAWAIFPSRADFLSMLALILLLYGLMLPTTSFIVGANYSKKHYLIGFALSLIFGYSMVGFLDKAFENFFSVFLLSFGLMLCASVAVYDLVRRAARSRQNGFLSKPLNLAASTLPLLLLVVTLLISARFPALFTWEYVALPPGLNGAFAAGALLAGVWGVAALNQFKQARIPRLIRDNLPGLYAGGIFFLINLVIARALNHPALGYNSVLFETDAGPWMEILASPQSAAINRAVHPLALILARPLLRLPASLMGAEWRLAAMLVVALLGGICVFGAYDFVKRATGASAYSFLFAALLGSTSTHLLFSSLTENYVFGMTLLIVSFLMIQTGEKRFSRLVPLGVAVFGITVTNLAQPVIGLFFNGNFAPAEENARPAGMFAGLKKAALYSLWVVALGVALTVFTSFAYPKAQTFFFVPADIAFEGNFVKPIYESPVAHVKEKLQVLARTMFLYNVVAPDPLVVVSQKKSDPFPTVDLKTYDWREHRFASYKDFGNLPLGMWLLLLGMALALFAKNARTSKHLPLMLGLLGCLGFNFVMHGFYGTELFLYTPYWTYALVFFVALACAELANQRWFETFLAFFVLINMLNGGRFIFTILQALAPFFSAL